MTCSIVLTIKSDKLQDHVQDAIQLTNKPREAALAISGMIKDMASGMHRGILYVQTGSAAPVAASGTLTCDTVIATDAITIGATTFTFTSSPTLSTDVEVDGADNTADAAALAAAINAHATASQIVTASSALGVVTITAKQKGVVGNFIPLSSADATITASAAFLTGGTGGVTETGSTFSLGL